MSHDVAIDISAITKRFGDRTIFSEVSVEVHRSEVVAIIGPSGSGKSTLIRCINQVTPFEQGRIDVLGHALYGTEEPDQPKPSRKTLHAIRKDVGMVFQGFNLFPHLTVRENITLAPRKVLGMSAADADAKAAELLDTVGLSHRIDALPKNMSGGEQQRAAICRALAMGPKVMLFDEPTSALDPELVGDVLDVIKRLVTEGMTTVLVTHEIEFAREVADTIIVMADGRVAEMGSADQVLRQPKSERAQAFLRRVLRYHDPSGALPESPTGQWDDSK
ncbi:ectoine/hydroxyectoine ABC transporter ATP-binding protein EhuA [Mycobacterium sp. MS1601]|uniref:amino acid ABC transporter ATP-binding protein n=1 Tax=Mycobacterium sp. MS1601 TaxID=1936029 RepID=UPI0009792464|nr:amino acid ABC transporter ATP-binding protein [Mycobacterium sp. MS1601]AQA02754.1 ectoine/hydroxyectoine ABC transporter ATP-binding protein EhuA [Mycobacterium sp. MS1601]